MDVNKLLKEDYQKWKNNQYIFQKEQGRFEGKTFGQFTEDTYRLAEHLLRLGLSDEKVIIYGRNSYALMVADLAVTAFVGISVVVAKDMKGESVRKLAEAIDAKAILYASEKEETVQKILETMNIRTICFDEIPRLPECEQLFQLTSRNPDVCSKIVFSSGTTGPSKGVQLSLRNIFFGYSELSKRVQYTTDDRVYLFLPLNHVYASCYCYYLSLIDGSGITADVLLRRTAGVSEAAGPVRRSDRTGLWVKDSVPVLQWSTVPEGAAERLPRTAHAAGIRNVRNSSVLLHRLSGRSG